MRRVRDAVATRVVGQDAAIEDVLVAFLARGHVLIEGVPGTAKTLLVRTSPTRWPCASRAFSSRRTSCPRTSPASRCIAIRRADSSSSRVRCSRICCSPTRSIARRRRRRRRCSRRCRSGRSRPTASSRPLDSLFTVLATQNPVEHEGTFPLPEAQLDRFLLKIVVGYPAGARSSRCSRCTNRDSIRSAAAEGP